MVFAGYRVPSLAAAPPAVELVAIFPLGGQAGSKFPLEISGPGSEGIQSLRCSVNGMTCRRVADRQFEFEIGPDVPPGIVDVWGVSGEGISAIRSFQVGVDPERREPDVGDPDAGDSLATPQGMEINHVINGRIEKGGDEDSFQIDGRQGELWVIECWAERVDSRLRAVLEVFDSQRKRLAVNRGYFGVDPCIPFLVPRDGRYTIKISDLAATGGLEHGYRLHVGTGPRVVYSTPSVVERGRPTRVTWHGWNLAIDRNGESKTGSIRHEAAGDPLSVWQSVESTVHVGLDEQHWPWSTVTVPAQGALHGLNYLLAGAKVPTWLGIAEHPVTVDGDNRTEESAQGLVPPIEVCGQLARADEQDWYSIDAKKGDVLHLEGVAQRIGTPLDLRITVLSPSRRDPWVQFDDVVENLGSNDFPTTHLDAGGRWVVPNDGRYFVVVENLFRSLPTSPRHVYRLSVRREEPRVQVVAIPSLDQTTGVNIPRGGRASVELIALREGGFRDAILIRGIDLPAGVECPDVWVGPDCRRGVAVLTASRDAPRVDDQLRFEVDIGQDRRQPVVPATIVRKGLPDGWGRLMSTIPVAIADDAKLTVTADCHRPFNHHLYGDLSPRHSPGGVVDVFVELDRADPRLVEEIRLFAVGLPDSIHEAVAVLPPGASSGWLSFYLPPEITPGKYSFAIRAEIGGNGWGGTPATVTALSNPLMIDVQPAAFTVQIDPFMPRYVRRGESVVVRYITKRTNGFIGKIHTELASPGIVMDVPGLRGRGVTFTGQGEMGSINVVVNPDAQIGYQRQLRLLAIGVVEDEAVYQGSALIPLEVLDQEDRSR